MAASDRRFARVWKGFLLPVAAVLLLVPIFAVQYFEWPEVISDGRFEYYFKDAIGMPGAFSARCIEAELASGVTALGGARLAFGILQLTGRLGIRSGYFISDLGISAAILILLAVSEQLSGLDRRSASFGFKCIAAIAAAVRDLHCSQLPRAR